MTRRASARAAALLAALVAAVAASAADGAPPEGRAAAARPVARARSGVEPRAVSASTDRPRVAPGVLVRATSRRGERPAGSPPAGEAPQAVVESVEIDWNGPASTR